MTPRFWETVAQRLYPYRRRFLIAALGTFLAMFLAMALTTFYASPIVQQWTMVVVPVVGFPTVSISWGLLCAVSWFEPSRGTMRRDNWLGRHLFIANEAMRWWCAFFLPLFISFGVIQAAWWMWIVFFDVPA